MKEFLFWVKRVSHMNRVSSKYIPDKFLALFLVAVVVIFALAFSTFPSSASDITSSKVIELANSDRSKSGLGGLRENEKLDKSAMSKAEDMIKNNYFAHTSPNGVTPWRWIEKEDYDYAYAGENLAMDFVSAEKMNQAWLASPTHRANILNEKYKDIGVAVKEGLINGHSTIIVVQQFGSGDKNAKEEKSSEKPLVDTLKSNKTDYPALPLEIKKAENHTASLFNPIITSPNQNEMMSSKDVDVIGRSAPNAKVILWDGEKEIGQTFANENGWFQNKVSQLSEGGHELRAVSEEYIGSAKKIKESLNVVKFSIDRSKPEANYRIYTKKDSLGNEEYFLRVTSSKPNCVFKVGGQIRNIINSRSAFFSISKSKLSSVIKIEDQAGNEQTKHIVLANYYQGSGQVNIIDKAAKVLNKDNVFASNSGRDVIMKNLGLAMANNN